jgi:putative membrane protein
VKTLATLSAVALALGAAACKQEGTSVSANQPQTELAVSDEPGVANLGGNAAVAGAPMTAQQFAETAAGSDLFEIQSGKLAQAKGSSSAVKGFGEMLVEEHTKSSTELKAAAAKVPGIALPVVPPPELQAKLDALKGLSGEAFDRQFIADQTASHQQTLAALNAYAATGDAPPLKEFASKATGVVQKHLNELGQIRQ